jgi:hypothetical protein
MTLTLLTAKGANDHQFKAAYAADYGTAQQKAVHLHRIMYTFSGTTEILASISYPVLSMSRLESGGYTKLVTFLLRAFSEAGIRPDTPFHKNEESKYPAELEDDYRYMEFNTIGGGMRLVVDCKLGAIFLSAHYSDPVLIRADSGTPHGETIDNLLTQMRLTRMIMKKHSDGTTHDDINAADISAEERARRCAKYAGWKSRSPAFKAWLHNKNASQNKAIVLDWYNEVI